MSVAEIVLLHGLGRTARIMENMNGYFKSRLFNVYNLDYPSTRFHLEQLADQLAAQIEHRRDPHLPLHFVGHSMGAILCHLYIQRHQPKNLGRVVALGPPYRGSEMIDHLGHYQWFKKLYGPAALELTTFKTGVCHRLGAIHYELGIIAGDRWAIQDWFFAKYWVQQPNDGKVSVASTRIEGGRDHIVLPVNHVHLPEYPSVIRQSEHFLLHGYFA